MIIGLSGVAGAGKDLFFSLLSKKLNCQKFSLADALKEEVAPFLQDQYDINPLTCTREEKDSIRPLLVFHGSFKRNLSEGRHWINKLNKEIKNNLTDSIVVITDIRYDDYPKDEVYWLKEELGGLLVHISMYEHIDRGFTSYNHYRKPINEEERRNDPEIEAQADYTVEWERVKGDIDRQLEPHINAFITWLNRKENGLSAYEKTENTRV
jgi:hypothetical protein